MFTPTTKHPTRKARQMKTSFRSGKQLLDAVRSYTDSCAEKNEELKKPIFPNVAGFCRSVGISVSAFRSLARRFPDDYLTALAFFEDAAINSGATASLISLYLKEYDCWGQTEEDEIHCDHDIFSAGA